MTETLNDIDWSDSSSTDAILKFIKDFPLTNQKALESKKLYKCFFFWGKRFHLFFKNTSILDSTGAMVQALRELLEVAHELDFQAAQVEISDIDKELDKNTRLITWFSMLMYIINIVSLKSVEFVVKIVEDGALKAHLDFLKDSEFIKQNLNNEHTDFSTSPYGVLDSIVLNINLFSKNYEKQMQLWNETDALNTLLATSRLKESIEFDCFTAITRIANDKQIETLTEIHKIVESLASALEKIPEKFNNYQIGRVHRQIVEDDEVINVDLIAIESNGVHTVMISYFQCLYKLAINDTARINIYNSGNFNSSLSQLLEISNEVERKHVLNLIAQLTFNQEIANDIRKKNTKLLELIGKYAADKNEPEKNVALCTQIQWNLNQTAAKEATPKPSVASDEGKHIMISYNTASRDLCLKIKSKLEVIGFKVWIDVAEIHGSSLDAMARAVENSYCVLICITEKYRQSVNCQSEAQYAFRTQKPIIPLIMEKGYENVKGWLGFIIGDKIFVNFTKYPFDECMRRLNLELGKTAHAFGDSADAVSPNQVVLPVAAKTAQDSVENWSSEKVREWFVQNKIHSDLLNALVPCSGEILQQLCDMRSEAPEFFFQAMSKKNGDLREILHLSSCLKKL